MADIHVKKSLYDVLWNDSFDIVQMILKADFLQGMASVRLSAERFMTFNLQDIYYLVKVTEMLAEMKGKPQTPPDLKTFFEKKYNSYQSFAASVLEKYCLKDASSIIPGLAMSSYLQTYREAMKLDPIYFVVAMLPCVSLWPYLAQHLDIKKNTAYYEWKDENMHGDPRKVYQPLLDKYACSINRETATALFRKQMSHEQEFFMASVTASPANALLSVCRSTVDHRHIFMPFSY
ncbi:uncharacterized protein [Osmerus mordax]|uniref:uncharacterized protein n=1 Tax=Osmerus mordax TaxID=8014 RepID=UPI00350EA4DA